MTALAKAVLALDRFVGRVALGVAAALLAVAAAVGLYQVVARFVLQQPSTWSEVLVRTLIAWMVFLGIAAALRSGTLVAFDFAFRISSGRVRQMLEAFVFLCCLALFAVLAWHGYRLAWRVRFQMLAGLDISIAWAYAAIPVGAACAMLAVVARWCDPGRHRKPPEPDTPT